MKRAIYPGSFDPVTLGHLDIIKRAAAMFDELIVCVSVNSSKHTGLFHPKERVELLRRVTEGISNVRVDCWDGLVAEYARRNQARVLVKGLRAVSDYESEIQMAMLNTKLYPRLDTIFLYTRPKYAYLSSTVVKEMARYGSDLSDFVPRQIIEDVEKKVRGTQERM
ncbi:MAG TPA: pantetheine-phosphate adenylyltransferase [Candidatus Enterenecus stercoripullorum]|nr:pantetheine-phosphate adenylyltransferase [Candidatus Enterenecus stercoripullorum]